MSYNKSKLSTKIIYSFLKDRRNFQLYMNAVYYPNRKNQQCLNEAFQNYYAEIHLLRYISQALTRYARDFLVKEKRNQQHYLLLMDKPMQTKESDGKQVTYGEWMVDDNDSVELKAEKKGQLIDHIENRNLYEALKKLTPRQTLILHFEFIYNLTNNDIAYKLNVTRQAVSKTKRQALSKLREYYENGV